MEIIFIATLLETAIVVLLLAIAFVAGHLLRDKRQRKLTLEKLEETRLEAKAIILAVEQTGLFMNHRPQVKMQMQVIPDRGRNFIAEIKDILSFVDLAAFKAGSTVMVHYNPANMKDVALVKAA